MTQAQMKIDYENNALLQYYLRRFVSHTGHRLWSTQLPIQQIRFSVLIQMVPRPGVFDFCEKAVLFFDIASNILFTRVQVAVLN